MEPERWQQIDKLLEAALEQEESQREAFLKEACGGADLEWPAVGTEPLTRARTSLLTLARKI